MLFDSEMYREKFRDDMSQVPKDLMVHYAIGTIEAIVESPVYSDEEARERVKDVLAVLNQMNGTEAPAYEGNGYEFGGEDE